MSINFVMDIISWKYRYFTLLYFQYRLCCSALCSIPTVLSCSILSTALTMLSALCSIPTMLLNSMLNTDYAAQLYATQLYAAQLSCSLGTDFAARLE